MFSGRALCQAATIITTIVAICPVYMQHRETKVDRSYSAFGAIMRNNRQPSTVHRWTHQANNKLPASNLETIVELGYNTAINLQASHKSQNNDRNKNSNLKVEFQCIGLCMLLVLMCKATSDRELCGPLSMLQNNTTFSDNYCLSDVKVLCMDYTVRNIDPSRKLRQHKNVYDSSSRTRLPHRSIK